jgi:hypothetical protein
MKNLKFVFGFMALLLTSLLLVSCMNASAQDDVYVTIDINPSIELITTPRERVVYANPLNEDGEILLANLDLIGKKLDVAMDLIITEAINLGFIDVDAEESFVYVSTLGMDSEIGEKIRERVMEHINNAFKEKVMVGRAMMKEYQAEIIEEANLLGVTPGFLRLAKSAVLLSDELLLEDALLLTVEELQAIIRQAKDEHKELAQSIKEEFLTEKEALFAEYKPQIEALEEEILNTVDEDQLLLLEEELEALKLEFKEKLEALRDEFLETTKQLRNQILETKLQLKGFNEDKVNEFMQNREQRHEQMRERIEEFQKNRP